MHYNYKYTSKNHEDNIQIYANINKNKFKQSIYNELQIKFFITRELCDK